MMRGFLLWVTVAAGVAGIAAAAGSSPPVAASGPAARRVVLLDTGGSLVQEQRSANLPAGECELSIDQLPETLDPATLWLVSGRDPEFAVRSFRFLHDASSPARMIRAMQGGNVALRTDSGTISGRLVGVTGPDTGPLGALVLESPGGHLQVVPAGRLIAVSLQSAEPVLFLLPRLVLQVSCGREGIHQLRLAYMVTNITWQATYQLLLPEEGEGRISDLWGRVVVHNGTGADLGPTEVILALTEAGEEYRRRLRDQHPLEPVGGEPVLRYRYGRTTPMTVGHLVGEGIVAEVPLRGVHPLAAHTTEFLPLVRVRPEAEEFLVYDGVEFARYRSMRRNDWNLGTESHRTVERYVEFVNDAPYPLPPGRVQVFRRRPDGSMELLGEDTLPLAATGSLCSLRLGPAAGLYGERRRISYTEVVPFHTYEETIEIALVNQTAQDHEVRVVEHLYRWHQYEIVRADTEYHQTAPQVIEFRPTVKAGGRRSIRYTVRYRW